MGPKISPTGESRTLCRFSCRNANDTWANQRTDIIIKFIIKKNVSQCKKLCRRNIVVSDSMEIFLESTWRRTLRCGNNLKGPILWKPTFSELVHMHLGPWRVDSHTNCETTQASRSFLSCLFQRTGDSTSHSDLPPNPTSGVGSLEWERPPIWVSPPSLRTSFAKVRPFFPTHGPNTRAPRRS